MVNAGYRPRSPAPRTSPSPVRPAVPCRSRSPRRRHVEHRRHARVDGEDVGRARSRVRRRVRLLACGVEPSSKVAADVVHVVSWCGSPGSSGRPHRPSPYRCRSSPRRSGSRRRRCSRHPKRRRRGRRASRCSRARSASPPAWRCRSRSPCSHPASSRRRARAGSTSRCSTCRSRIVPLFNANDVVNGYCRSADTLAATTV